MPQRRILSLWFPRMAVERMLRQRRPTLPLCLAVVADRGGAQVLVSLNPEAEAAGLRAGQPLRDATAMCPELVTHPAEPSREAAFLTVLRRWAGKFSPWVAEEAPDGLMVDLTGCAHLFGGEAALLEVVAQDCADLGLTVRSAVADTAGAAWALARHSGRLAGWGMGPRRNGDAIEQEAYATRSRAVKRRNWERGGTAPALAGEGAGKAAVPAGIIAPVGRLREALAGLPLAALRLTPETVEGLQRLGLRRIDEIAGLPRGALTRRFGAEVLHRLDQAMGIVPEPITPARAPLHFATRLTLPDPIGLLSDIEAGMDRLLPPLCARLQAAGRGARRVRLQAFRSDGVLSEIEVGLARAAAHPDRIRPLLLLKLPRIDAGFGIDCLRLAAVETEPVHALQHRGQLEAAAGAVARETADTALDDLIARLGARLGSDEVLRIHPAESHIPEKSATLYAAAWCAPWAEAWPRPPAPRPLLLLRPERVSAPEDPMPPARFRWRRRDLQTRLATGPERILPEWWLDDPDWRSGARDYWQVEVEGGERLWLFYAHGPEGVPGWFCHGQFA